MASEQPIAPFRHLESALKYLLGTLGHLQGLLEHLQGAYGHLPGSIRLNLLLVFVIVLLGLVKD
jgi:hypothetical protein